MLSPLSVVGSPRFSNALKILSVATFFSSAAFGADIMAPTAYAPGTAGSVSEAGLAERGTITTGLTLSGAEGALHEQDVSVGVTEKNEILRDAHRASAFFGLALTKKMEFVLGLHGSYEHVDANDRAVYFTEINEERRLTRISSDRLIGARQTSFAGASLMFKVALLDQGHLRISAAPFIESGAGEQATYALTRSVAPKAGWMLLGTYGQKGRTIASINAGYRYRNAEDIGALTLRNELFYRASVQTFITESLALFTAADARKIMVNRNSLRDEDGKILYSPRETAGWTAGVTASLGDAEVSFSYGGRFSQAKGFGFGDRSFGMGITYELGHVDGRRPKPRFAEEVEREMRRESSPETVAADQIAEKKRDGKQDEISVNSTSVAEEFPEMIGTDIDPLELFKDENDDFRQTEAEMAEYNKQTGPSSDQQVEDELEDLKTKEQQEEEIRQREEQRQTEQNRAEARKQAQIEDENMQEWMQEAEGDLNEVEGISDQELNWNGLE